VCVSVQSSDTERTRLMYENEQLRSELRRVEAAMKQTALDADTVHQVCVNVFASYFAELMSSRVFTAGN